MTKIISTIKQEHSYLYANKIVTRYVSHQSWKRFVFHPPFNSNSTILHEKLIPYNFNWTIQ